MAAKVIAAGFRVNLCRKRVTPQAKAEGNCGGQPVGHAAHRCGSKKSKQLTKREKLSRPAAA